MSTSPAAHSTALDRDIDIEKKVPSPSSPVSEHSMSQAPDEEKGGERENVSEQQAENREQNGARNDGTRPTIVQRCKERFTRAAPPAATEPGPAPDGGLTAWTQVLMGHLVIFNTWGICYTFGVFQSHYTSDLGLNASAVSWIGSIQLLGLFCLGMITGRMFDAGIPTILPGMLIGCFSMFMTSLCTKYWQFFLAQGILNGIGNGLQFAPTLSIVATYFTRHRSLAVALFASGGATGGLVYPTVARQLIDRIGFPWTVRIMAFIMLAVGTLYSALLRRRIPPRKSGPMFELNAFKEKPYALFCVGVFFSMIGQFFAFYYISSFAQNVLHLPYSTAVNVLLTMNGVGILGRLIPSYFADKYTGPFNILIFQGFVASLLLYLWPLVKNTAGLYVFSVFYGLFVSGFQGIFPATLTTLTKDLSKAGTRNGQGLAVAGLGAFIGPPIAGALIQSRGGSYLTAQMFAGSIVLFGCMVLVVGRLTKTGPKILARV